MPRGRLEKCIPLFWHPCFDHSEGIFLFVLCRRSFGSLRFKGRSPLFLPKVVCFGPFERSKPLGVLFALFVPLVPKVFWFGPFRRSKPLGVRLDKYAKFTDSVYFANLLFCVASRCLPKLATWAA